MSDLTFSIARFLGAKIITVDGIVAGDLRDIVGNGKSGFMTYYMINCPFSEAVYAIHHSYFMVDIEDKVLTFDAQRGGLTNDLFPDLPGSYDDVPVYTCEDYIDSVLPNLQLANHRTDNE